MSNMTWRARLQVVVLGKVVVLRHILELFSLVIRGSNQINCNWFDDENMSAELVQGFDRKLKFDQVALICKLPKIGLSGTNNMQLNAIDASI